MVAVNETCLVAYKVLNSHQYAEVFICKLEGDPQWSLEVVTRDGTSIVWDDLFDDDAAALEEAISTIRDEGARDFERGGSNIVPFKR